MTKPLKIVKIGNSFGIVLPREVMGRLHVGPGDNVHLADAPGGYHMTASDPEFEQKMAVAEQVMREDRDILAVLAK